MANHYPYVKKLARTLNTERERKGYSFKALSKRSGVDVAQVHRICTGNFKRLGQSVLQICSALNVDPPGAESIGSFDAPGANELVSELLASWDKTAEGAKNLSNLLAAVRNLGQR